MKRTLHSIRSIRCVFCTFFTYEYRHAKEETNKMLSSNVSRSPQMNKKEKEEERMKGMSIEFRIKKVAHSTKKVELFYFFSFLTQYKWLIYCFIYDIRNANCLLLKNWCAQKRWIFFVLLLNRNVNRCQIQIRWWNNKKCKSIIHDSYVSYVHTRATSSESIRIRCWVQCHHKSCFYKNFFCLTFCHFSRCIFLCKY